MQLLLVAGCGDMSPPHASSSIHHQLTDTQSTLVGKQVQCLISPFVEVTRWIFALPPLAGPLEFEFGSIVRRRADVGELECPFVTVITGSKHCCCKAAVAIVVAIGCRCCCCALFTYTFFFDVGASPSAASGDSFTSMVKSTSAVMSYR